MTHDRARGFTLIELLVVIALVAIIAGLAVPNIREMRAAQDVRSAASDLMASLMTARNAALSRGRRVNVEPLTGADWLSGWRTYVDTNSNGSLDTGEEVLATRPSLPPNVQIITPPGGGCDSLGDSFGFNAVGFLAGGGVANAGVPFGSSESTRQRCVAVARTGRARICGPGVATC